MGDNDLTILIETAIDLEKSLSTMTAQMNQLREKFKNYKIQITAGLNQTASAAQIKSDLAQINKAKNRVQLTGQMDRDATKKNIDSALNKLKDTEIKITGVLDSAATTSNIQSSLGDIHDVTARADIEVEGAGQVDDLRRKMDEASKSASGMAAQVYLARTALTALRTAARETISTVTELDAAVTDLSMATGESRDSTYQLLNEYNNLAGQLGATTAQVAAAADEWLRQGMSAQEAVGLIEQSMVLSKVAQMDSSTATERLTSALKGYKLEAADASSIVDKLTSVDLRAAVTAGDLAESMSRTANSANLAGIEMNKLIGYLAVVQETTQRSASTVGESFKTVFARMGNVKLGKFIDDDGEDLSDVEKILKSFGIALRASNDEFRNFGEVLDDVAAKWDNLSTVDKNALATTLAGVRQRENFLILMENYGKAMEYASVAADSAGTSMEKFALYQESIEARAAAFTAAVESLTLDTIDAGFVGDLIDAGTAIIELVEKIGLLKSALIGLGAGALLKGVTVISEGFLAAKQNVLSLGTAIQTLRDVGNVGKMSVDTIQTLGTLSKGLSNEQLRLVLTSQQLSTAQMQAILMASGLTETEAAQKLTTLGLASAQGTATVATGGLSAAMTGLGTAIKAAFATNPVGMIMLAVSAVAMAVQGVWALYDALTETAEEAMEKMKESFSDFEDATSKVNSLNDELETTKDRIDELVSKDSLTFVEESELQKLRESVELLTIQADLAEKERIRAAKESADATVNAYRKNFAGNITQEQVDSYITTSSATGNNAILLDSTDDIAAMLAGIEQMRRLRDECEKSSDDFLHFQGVIDNTTDIIWEQADVLSTYKNNLEAIPYDELTDDQRAALDEINAAIQLIYQNLDPAKWKEIQWNSIVNNDKYANDVNALKTLAAEAAITADTIREQFLALVQACEDAGLEIDDVVDNLNASFGRADSEGVPTYTANLSKLSDVISELKSSYDLLEVAQKDMADGGGLSPETIAKLADAEENYLDYLYEENGVVKLNTEAWKENANAKMLGEIDEIQKEIDAIEEENAALEALIEEYKAKRLAALESQDMSAYYSYYSAIDDLTEKINENNKAIAENQSKIAIYENLFESIAGAAGQLESTLNVFDGYTSNMESLADLQELVANGFTVAADKVRELAAVYPEILEAATATANGEIQLNEDVVNAVLQGKRTELDKTIDAEIGKLTAKRALLEAELGIINEQVAAAENADDAKVASANEAASAKMAIEQAVLSACEQAGIDEKTANEMALAAMTGDWDTFSTLAQQAMYDLDDESATAFTSVMNNFATMSRSVVNNTNEVIGAYSQMGDALSRAMQGLTTGKYNASISGGSVSSKGKEAAENLLADMFEAAKSDYGSDGTTLNNQMDVWQQRLQDIADSYTNTGSNLDELLSKQASLNKQIQSVNGQIELLESLKNKPLNSFRSSGSSSKSGSGSSQKEVEEYTATIDKYREAVEALRKAQEEAGRIKGEIENTESYEKKIALEKELIQAYKAEQAALHNLNDARDATIKAGVQSLRDLGFAVQYNADTNELWIENMEYINELTADNKGSYASLQEATNALRKETEDLIGTLEDLNEANRDGSSTWRDLQDSIRDAKVAIINDLKDIVDQASDAVNEIQNVYDTLHDAADEFAANDGFLTVDTIQALLKLCPQYMQMLKAENGLWEINEERINAVVAARTQQLAVENAMSYVERIKLATQEGAIENLNDLIFVTTDATNSTWGLVYAELELMHTMGELNDSQYQAALHNIRAMQDLAENAIQNIGKATDSVAKNLEETRKQLENTKKGLQDLLDELEDMQNGADDLIKYVMDMLKHRIKEQISLLEEMKDKYSEIIQLKKDSLDATKDEQDYQKTIAKKLKEMAKLQERINALSLDDSRSAQAERAKLLEQMAELQEDLADTQAGKSIEAQKDALDQMEKDFHEEKDAEIKILEDSISSYQKSYDMAIEYIRNNWRTLYQELADYNYSYGSVLTSQISEAWESAQAAAGRYGDFVSAVMGGISNDIDSITKQIEALDAQMSSFSSKSSGSGIGVDGTSNRNTTVGSKTESNSYANKDMVSSIVSRMKGLSSQWNTSGDKAALHQQAANLASQLDGWGVHADYNGADGTWTITRDDIDPSNVGRLLYSRYHTGGFVGKEPLKPNERYVKAEDGELILTSDQQSDIATRLGRIDAMVDKFTGSPTLGITPMVGSGLSQIERNTINNITNNSRPIEISIGDTIIHGNASPDTVAAHGRMNEQMVNDLARLLGVKW